MTDLFRYEVQYTYSVDGKMEHEFASRREEQSLLMQRLLDHYFVKYDM